MAPLFSGSSSKSRRDSRYPLRRNRTTIKNTEEIELSGFVIRFAGASGNRIKFPHGFTERWGYLITHQVNITTKEGDRHLIKVERRNGNIWLGEGWDSFRERYNIKILDTLYFRYRFNDNFTVVMFNPAGVEYRQERLAPTRLPVSFVKQIVSRDYATRIALPDHFSSAYGRRLQTPTTLVGPDGVEWAVELVVIDGSLWLTEGWTDFALNYDVQKRDVLYFKVRDISTMRVRVVQSRLGMFEIAQRIGPDDIMDIDARLRELWTVKISEASLSRRLPLYVPAGVVSSCLRHRPGYVEVMLPSGFADMWELHWSPGRPNECYIGVGWYTFKETHKIKPGQRVKFSKKGDRDYFIVQLI